METIVKQFLSQFSLEKIIFLAGGIIFLLYIKSPLESFLYGLSIRFGRRINEGNKVEIAGKRGVVKSVGVKFVILKGENGEEIFIPNDRIRFFPSVLYPQCLTNIPERVKMLEEIIKKKRK